MTALIVTALVLVTSAVVSIPLGEMANEGLSPNPAKAPWYFSGFQELLFHFHPSVAAWMFPLALAAFFCWIPYIRYPETTPSNWFMNREGKTSAILSFSFGVLIAAAVILAGEFGPGPNTAGRGIPPAIFAGLVFFFLLKKRFRLNLNLTVQAVLVQIMAVYITLALTTTLFRGQGMALKGLP